MVLLLPQCCANTYRGELVELPRILVVEDEEAILFALTRYLATRGYEADGASDLEAARRMLSYQRYGVVIADLRLGIEGTEGLEVLACARLHNPAVRMILLTAYGSPEIESEAIRRGAYTILRKPIPLPDIAQVICAMEAMA